MNAILNNPDAGKRPIPSCLGGGDLDGDVYNLLPLAIHRSLTPLRYFKPGEYAPAVRKQLTRPSTMKDVADFVMEYIVSDVSGVAIHVQCFSNVASGHRDCRLSLACHR